jgi:long-chain fatty acid transport protein
MAPRFRRGQSLLLASLIVTLPITKANAAGFQLREGSPDWVANAFAGMAAKAYDAGTAWTNPAGMTFLNMHGKNVEVDSALNLILPSVRFHGQDVIDSTAIVGTAGGNASPPAMTPGFEAVWNYTDTLRFGIALETPFGLSTSYASSFVGRYQAIVSSITDAELFPSAAYRITPQLSIGGGPVIDYYHTRLTSAINTGPAAALTGDPAADIHGDAVAAGYHLGAIYQFDDHLRLGIDYRSRIGIPISGKQTVFVPPLLQAASPATAALLTGGNSSVTTQTTIPDVLTLGSYYEISPEWAVMGTLQWTHWSLLQEATIVAANGQVQRLDLGFRSSWFGSVGVNHKPAWANGLMLQAGVGFDESPVTDRTRSPRLPDSGRVPFSFGATYEAIPNLLNVQFAYLHEFTVNSTASRFSASPAAGVLLGKYSTSADVISVGTRLRF